MGQANVFRMAPGWRKLYLACAVISGLTVILLPLAIICWLLATRAHITVTDEALLVRWFGTRVLPWEDFHEFGWAHHKGTVGPGGTLHVVNTELGRNLGRVITYSLKSQPHTQAMTPQSRPRIAIHMMERPEKLVEAIEHRTGLSLPI